MTLVAEAIEKANESAAAEEPTANEPEIKETEPTTESEPEKQAEGESRDALKAKDEPVDSQSSDPESKSEEPAADANAGPEFDDELIDIAGDYGMSEEKARSFGTPEKLGTELRRIIAREERQELRLKGDERRAKSAAAGKEPDKVDTEPASSFKLKDVEDIDESVVGAVDRVLEQIGTQMGSMNSTIQGLQETVNQQANSLIVAEMDTLIREYGQEYEDVLGKGRYSANEPGGTIQGNYQRMVEEWQDVVSRANERGRPIPGEEQLFRRVARELFGDRDSRKKEKADADADKKAHEAGRQGQVLNRSASKSPAASIDNNSMEAKLERISEAIGRATGKV